MKTKLVPVITSGMSLVELQDTSGEYHVFDILHNDKIIAYGSTCNTGFLESGYMEKDNDFSLDENLQELISDLQVMIDDGMEYASGLKTRAHALVQ